MTHANQTDINNSTSRFNTVIVFRTQRLLDLFKKEMQGQISDGMWENSRNTDWLWRNVACVLGDETRVIVAYRFVIGKKNFMIGSTLWDCIGERILRELEYSSKKEVYADWREIAEAIRNAREMNDEERKTYVNDCEARGRNREKALKQKTQEVLSELIKRVGVENVQGRIIKEGQVYVTDPEKRHLAFALQVRVLVGQIKPGLMCPAIRTEWVQSKSELQPISSSLKQLSTL